MNLAVRRDREFDFTEGDFHRIRNLVEDYCGITLGDHKRELVYGRLSRRLRKLRMRSCKEYLRYLESNEADELTELINALTTNVTHFFREPHHFEYLKGTLLPALWKRNKATRRLRIWSAGCSTGQEPYSIAMTILEALPFQAGWDVKILATDLDSNVLARASAGIYAKGDLEDIPTEKLKRWFQRGSGNQKGFVRAKHELRELVTFKQLNLLEAWPMQGMFDAIFCRNVVIYFGPETTDELIQRFYDRLQDGGHLFLGHSERTGPKSRFKHSGLTIYRKEG